MLNYHLSDSEQALQPHDGTESDYSHSMEGHRGQALQLYMDIEIRSGTGMCTFKQIMIKGPPPSVGNLLRKTTNRGSSVLSLPSCDMTPCHEGPTAGDTHMFQKKST